MKNRLTTYLAGIIISVLFSLSAFGQVNTPAGATWPFGSRIQQFPTNPYSYGIIPTTLPAGAYTPASNLYGKSQDAYLAYVNWKSCYVYNCGGGQMRVRFDNAVETVSEGIGYGMLLAAYAADKTLFDGLWAYYKAHANANGLMNWHIGNGGASACTSPGTVLGTNGASDGDLDAAMALIVAACQWPLVTSPYTYATEAKNQIANIRLHEISGCGTGTNQIGNGDGWIGGCPGTNTCRNPSYMAPAYIRQFQAADPGAAANFWTTTVFSTIYPLLNANRNTTTGFVSNWSDQTGAVNGCGTPNNQDHGYDAIRNPWRMAVDYIWFGEPQAKNNFCQLISNYIRTQSSTYTAPANLKGPVTLAGAQIGGRTTASPDATFTSMWGASTMGVDNVGNNQATLNWMYNRVNAVQDANNCTNGSSTGYFGNTLRVISLFMMTGNFWKPCPPKCQGPAFATDSITTCGAVSVTLDPNIATGGITPRTFQWFKNGISLGAASTSANTLLVNATTPAPNGPGWFKVVLDSGTCVLSDSIYVSSTAIYPNLGANKTICANTPITLNSNITGTGYTYQWSFASNYNYASLVVVPSQTGSTYTNVRASGLYKVTISKAGCTTVSDTVEVTSSVISPVDNCTLSNPGTAALSITGSNLGPASQYDWYSVPTNGTVLAGGTGTYTYNTGSMAAGTYTYYVQDKTRQYGSVGKTAPSSPPVAPSTTCAGWTALNADGITSSSGSDNYNTYAHAITVSRTINIDSVTVWYCLYNNTMPTIQFQLTTVSISAPPAIATGITVIQTSVTQPGVRIVNPVGSYGPPYNGFLQGVRYYVGLTNIAPGNYWIKALTGSNAGGNMYIEQDPNNVGYNYYDNIDGQTMYISRTFGYNTSFANRYAHFYDWTISAQNNCARVPVYAYIGSCPIGLPLNLLSFEGKSNPGYNRLTWATISEINTAYFLIERAGSDGNYDVIGRVEANGNTNAISEYNFTDRSIPAGGAYYRLAQYDVDGTKYLSNAIYISEYQSNQVTVFPNPANTSVTIRAQQAGSEFNAVELLDIYGKQITIQTGNTSERSIDISILQTGIYFIRITFEEGSETLRLIKN
jgi:endo-1,4-beta-D-glucanase Y